MEKRTRQYLAISVLVWILLLIISWWFTASTKHLVLNMGASYLAAWGLLFAFSAKSLRHNILNAILVNSSIGLIIFALELPVLLNVLDYRTVLNTPILAPWRNPIYQEDPEIIYVRRPHAHVQGTSRGGDIAHVFHMPNAKLYDYDLHYDKHGFRNLQDLDSTTYVLIGDSFIEGNLVSYNDLVGPRLSQLTEATVTNMGIIGYGPRHELILLKRYVIAMQPRAVIWLFFEGNDLKNVHDFDSMMIDLKQIRSTSHSFIQRSFTKNALMAIARLVGDPKPSGLPRSGLFQTNSGNKERLYFLYPGELLDTTELEALASTRDILTEAHRLCAANGIKFFVAFAPTKYRVYHDLLELDQESELTTWTINDLPERLRALVKTSLPGAGYIDLTPDFVKLASAGQLLYLSDDSHWNAAGNHLAAQILHRAITKWQDKGNVSVRDNVSTSPNDGTSP
jgi:hypothetical protein